MLKNRRLLNLISGLACQILSSIFGLVIPNFILNTYGSVLNGLLSMVTQMMAYLSLVEMGLTSAALVSLYKPMAVKDYEKASEIFTAVNKFYQRIAIWFSCGVIICGIVSLYIIDDNIPSITIWLVILSLAGNNLVSYLLLNKYKVLLQADDKLYILNFTHLFGIIIQFLLSYCAIIIKTNIACVKTSIIIASLLEFFVLFAYSRKKIPELKIKEKIPDNLIKQRNDILIHQLLSLVLNNTDVILLTIFSPSLSIVSVYTVYAMVESLVQNIANTIIGMFSSKMGQLYAICDYNSVNMILKKYEGLYGVGLFSLFSCMDIMIMPFVSIYTKGIIDQKYYYPTLGLLFSLYGIVRMFRLPYTELTYAAGRYKETKIQAILEASINLILSIILLPVYGIAGVLIGSIVGEVYRTIHSYIYCNRFVLRFDWIRSILLCGINCFLFVIIHLLMIDVRHMMINSYSKFFLVAAICGLIIFLLYAFINYAVIFIIDKERERK